LKIPNLEAVNRKWTDNTMTEIKRANNNMQNTT